MKTSIYNSILTVSEKHTLMFNAFSGKFLVLKNNIFKNQKIDPHSIELSDPILFSQMEEAGIIIDDSVDEMEILRSKIIDCDNNSHEFILHVNPTLDCNFRCWYCYENHVTGSVISNDMMESVNKFVSATLSSNSEIKRFRLSFFGGEPLLHFREVEKLIDSISAICKQFGTSFHVSFTTNGALFTPSIISYLANYNSGFQITLDGDRFSHDKTRFFRGGKGSFDIIMQNVRSLIKNEMEVILRINFTKKNVFGISEIMDILHELPSGDREYLSVDLQRVWQDREGNYDQTDDIADSYRNELRKIGVKVSDYRMRSRMYDSCYGDKVNHVLVNYNGDVYGCTARDFNKANRIGHLNSDGVIEYIGDVKKRRDSAKFAKPMCHTCRIAPICGGGCRQRAYESLNDAGCVYGYTEEDKDRRILNIFEYSFCKQ